MRLEEVVITNFCSCHSVRIALSSYTPIIGYNNSGKSNVLRAISWLLKKHVLQKQTFWDPNQPVLVEGFIAQVNVGLLPANQQAQVNPYIANGSLRFRRRQDAPGVPIGQVKIEVFDPTNGQWVANPTGLDNAIGVLFPEPLHIEAMEDAAEEVSKFAAKNTIGLILKYTLEQIRNNNQQALTAVDAAIHQISTILNGPNRIQQLRDLELQAAQAIAPFFPNIEMKIGIDAPTLDDLVKGAAVSLTEVGGAERPFTSFGHGAQRSVHMAMIKLLASYAHAGNAATVVLLIDEPELYLHPQAIEVLRESLKQLSTQGFQIVFSTHSPLLIADDDVLNTNVVYKDAGGGTVLRQRLANAAQVLAGNPHQAAVIFSIQHATFLLFSESVLVVEGKTERTLLPPLYQLVRGNSLGHNKGCVVEASSSSSIVPMLQVLRAVGYSPKAVADLDFVFKVAPGYGLVQQNSPEFVSCLTWFAANTAIGYCLGNDGLPSRRDAAGNVAKVLPEQAYLSMAIAMSQEVNALAATLRTQGIWIWTSGAIEAHLGIQKNDTDRAAFLTQARSTHSLNHAADPASLGACLAWI